jgi:hypothetical protein
MGRGDVPQTRHVRPFVITDPTPFKDLNKVNEIRLRHKYKKHVSFYFFPGRARASATIIFSKPIEKTTHPNPQF